MRAKPGYLPDVPVFVPVVVPHLGVLNPQVEQLGFNVSRHPKSVNV